MCGVLGFAGTIPQNTVLNWAAALATIKHRGPDSTGSCVGSIGKTCSPFYENRQIGAAFESGPAIAFGHQRLNIIDLTEASNQPMYRDGLAMVYNGEIYNYIELRHELVALGHRFHSEGDTEVLLAAYQQWGRECVHKLRGMFAIAIYDSKARQLWLVRDRFAIKPMYVRAGNGFVAFASEPKAILSLLSEVGTPCDRALFDLICNHRYESGSASFYQGINQLLAGEEWLIDLESLVIEKSKYYSLGVVIPNLDPLPDTADTVDYYRSVFDETIALHLRSDTPLGACLSGGLDSSSIVATVGKNHLADLGSKQQRFETFSALYPDKGIDESAYVAAVVKSTGVESHTISPCVTGLMQSLPTICQLHDGPVAYPSILVQNSVFKLAAEHGVKVLLDGQGGDETLGGYPVFILQYILNLWKTSPSSFLARGIEVWFKGDPALKGLFWSYLRRGFHRSKGDLLASSMNPDRFGHFKTQQSLSLGRRDINSIRSKHLQEYPVPGLCKNEDRNSMAHSLESRVPMLDHCHVETALRLSPKMLFGRGLGKFILRKAMQGRLPNEVLWRRAKLGFPTPEQRTLGNLSFEDFEKGLKHKSRLFEIFNGISKLELQRQWRNISLRRRFQLLSIDAWLSTM